MPYIKICAHPLCETRIGLAASHCQRHSKVNDQPTCTYGGCSQAGKMDVSVLDGELEVKTVLWCCERHARIVESGNERQRVSYTHPSQRHGSGYSKELTKCLKRSGEIE